MEGFDLDLETIEREVDIDADRRVVLGILDEETAGDDWVEEVESGSVLVLNIDGDINRLAAGFAREVKEAGGSIVHFRGFLVISPPDVEIDTDRL